MDDLVIIEGLRLEAFIGVYAHETLVRQTLIVDIRMSADLRRAALEDDLRETVDYDAAAALAREVAGTRHHKLIEKVADEIAERILAAFKGRVAEIQVRVAKPGAVPDARTVAVEVTRRWREGRS